MNNLAVFQSNGQEFPLTIHDANGQRWVTAQDVGNALGASNIRELIRQLVERGEMVDDKHICQVSLQMPGDSQPRKMTVLSCRGVIRIAMRAQTERAIIFRDWAEDVLYEVMETGSYAGPSLKQFITARQYKEAMAITEVHVKMAKILGTCTQMARVIGVDRAKKETGVDFSPLLIGNNAVEEKPLTPTNLGKLMAPVLSGIAMNKKLNELGYQVRNESDEWIPTEKGKPFCSLEPFKSPNSEHSGYRVLWFPRVIKDMDFSKNEVMA